MRTQWLAGAALLGLLASGTAPMAEVDAVAAVAAVAAVTAITAVDASAGNVSVPERGGAAGAVAPVAALAVGAPETRALAAGERQAWRAELRAGASFLVGVEQLGIDVAVAARGPAGGPPEIEVDSPLDRQGREWLLIVVATGGAYDIEVRAREAGTPPAGRYVIRIDEVAATGAQREAAAALTEAGQLYAAGTAEGRRQALPLYLQARQGLGAAGDRRGEAQALYEAAVMARLVDRAREAGDLARQALELWRALGDGGFVAACENEAGLDGWLVGERAAAEAAFGRALTLAEAAGDPYGAAVAASNLCLMTLARGDLRQGAECYDHAVLRLAAVGAGDLLAAALTSAGRAYDALSEPDEAAGRYAQALERQRAMHNRTGEARILNSLGLLAADAGDVEEALARQGEALAIFRQLDDRRWQAYVLNNLGIVYQATGAYPEALTAYREALSLSRAVGDRAGTAAKLINLGLVHSQLGDPQAALAAHREALEIERALGDRRGIGIALTQLGRTAIAGGDAAGGLAYLEEAVADFAAIGDHRNEADALRDRGQGRAALGDGAGALASFRQALAAAQAAHNLPGEALALYAVADAEHRCGQAGAARQHAGEALAAIEALRARIGDPDLKASFSALIHRAYELDIQLLMEAHRSDPAAGFDRQALAVAERARARTLLELLGTAGVRPAGGAATDPDAGGEGGARGTVAALAARRDALATRLAAGGERPAANGGRQDALRDLELVEAELRRRSPAYAALVAPQPLDAAGAQALLDPGTLLLVYSLGDDRSYLWTVDGDHTTAYELPPRSTLEAPARRLHELWSAAAEPGSRRQAAETATALAAMLLGPAAEPVAGARRLVVVPDGALSYLAFAALPQPGGAPGEVLLDRHELVVLASASALAVERRAAAARGPADKWLAVLADPVFGRDDPRLAGVGGKAGDGKGVDVAGGAGGTGSAGGASGAGERGDGDDGQGELPRLPASRQEAAAIAALAPPGEAMVALDFAASRQAVLGDRLSRYRVVHFATHAVLDAEHPALSGLALSQVAADGRPQHGFLHLRDIYNLRLGADLVVLSGCRTALGREVRGEGLVGLARGFQYAGAARVMASLWRVEDRATAALMTRFYRALWSERLPPAAALRSAELSLRSEWPYRDPFYWAGFVLIGDWR